MEALIGLQADFDSYQASLRNLFLDMYGADAALESPQSGGVRGTANWLYRNYNQQFLDAMVRDLGLEFKVGEAVNYDHKFKKVVDIFNRLIVEQKTTVGDDGVKYHSLLIEALLAELGEIISTGHDEGQLDGKYYFERFNQFKEHILEVVLTYNPEDTLPFDGNLPYDNEFADIWAFYCEHLDGREPEADDIWGNLIFLQAINVETNYQAFRMWKGLEMRVQQLYDPKTLKYTGEVGFNEEDSVYIYESKLVTENRIDILRLIRQMQMTQENIANLYKTVGGWVTELNFIPDYLNTSGAYSVPLRYISDEKGSVSGYFRLRYLVSPTNAKLGESYFVEKVEVVATPSTRAAAGEIRIDDAWDDEVSSAGFNFPTPNERELWIIVYVENIKAFEGKNVGFVTTLTNKNFNQQEYVEDDNSTREVEDETVRRFRSEINYAKVEYNEVGIATRKDITQIDQPIVVRGVGESDEAALARAREGKAIQFISTDEYSFNLGEKLIPYVYDPDRPEATQASIFELRRGALTFRGKTHNQIIPSNGLVKVEILPGEDGKYLVLDNDGETLKRTPIVGGTDHSFGQFQYVKLTYEFEGWRKWNEYEAPQLLEKEGKVTRVAYLKLVMTDPALAALKEFEFSTTHLTNVPAYTYLLNFNNKGFMEQLGYNYNDFENIYGDPTFVSNDAIFGFDDTGEPRISVEKDTPVGEYSAVYTYTAQGYPTVKITWNVTLELPTLKAHQLRTSLPYDDEAGKWQYLPLKTLFNLNIETDDIEFNGEVDKYWFVIKGLPSGFRLVNKGGGLYHILRSNPEIGEVDDKAAEFDGKKIFLDGPAKADFWQAVRRDGGFIVDLVALRGTHETVVLTNVRVNFDYLMSYGTIPETFQVDNNQDETIKDWAVEFAAIDILWAGEVTNGNGWYLDEGETPEIKFAGTAFVTNNAGEYVRLPQRYMERLTITDTGITWKGKTTLNVPSNELNIYLPVVFKHRFGTYFEYLHLQVVNP